MQREELRETLQAILEGELNEEVPSLDDEVQLHLQLGLDSMDMVSLVMRVEQQLRIRMTHEELVQVETVGELLDLILTKLTIPALAAA
jgi:acyl carrier protein